MNSQALTVAERESNALPDRINVTKVVTYDVAEITNSLRELGALEDDKEPTLEDILWLVEDFAKEDFGCGHGHNASIRDLIFQDENGEELN